MFLNAVKISSNTQLLFSRFGFCIFSTSSPHDLFVLSTRRLSFYGFPSEICRFLLAIMRKIIFALLYLCFGAVLASDDEWDDLSNMPSFLKDDDLSYKRHNNEGRCRDSEDGSFTCSCLFREKPAFSHSLWLKSIEQRRFSHKCESIGLDYHEDTCQVLLGNPKGVDKWEFYCPNEGFLQTWGAFCPLPDHHHIRLWFRCCNVKCPKWNCQWTPRTVAQQPFDLPLTDLYVQGVRGYYSHDSKDSEWELMICGCDTTSKRDEL